MSTQWLPLSLVMAGGALGAGLRYLTGTALGGVLGAPWPTMAINLAGSFCIGWLVGTQLEAPWFIAWGRYLLVTGVLGGFTTYSAFAMDAVGLLVEGRIGQAGAYAAGTAIGCICMAWLGLRLGS